MVIPTIQFLEPSKMSTIGARYWAQQLLSFTLQKSEKSTFSWFPDLVDMTMTLQTHHSRFWTHQNINRKNKKAQNPSLDIILGEIFKSRKSIISKDVRRTILEMLLVNLSKSWIRNHYLSKHMKWKCCNFQSNELKSNWFSFAITGIPPTKFRFPPLHPHTPMDWKWFQQ